MVQDDVRPDIERGISTRLKQLRLEMYGPRGASDFARELGVAPGAYRGYEKTRAAPAEVLARAAQLTGVDLLWLTTGRKRNGPDPDVLPADRRELLERIERLARRNPASLRAVQRFLDLLEETVPAQQDAPEKGGRRGGWLPVLGRSAAGVVFFWKDLPGQSGTSPADRLSELIESYLKAQTSAESSARIERTDSRTPEVSGDAVRLIQVNVPTDAEVTEFLDCPAVRKRYPDAFALRIDGASMAPQLIHGDLVIVSPSVPAVSGQPAVVQLRGQLGVTCKLYRTEGTTVHLIPVNETFEPQCFDLSEVVWALRVLFRVRVD